MSGQLMEFDYKAGGLLKVNYSDKLVTLVKTPVSLANMDSKFQKQFMQSLKMPKSSTKKE